MTSLYEKYRPQKLSDMIGTITRQKCKVIEERLKAGTLSRAILLVGTTGSGKTTIARIIGKSSTIMPDLDYQEYNMSDLTGIDDVRRIAEGMSTAGSGGEKTYVFDEAHNMSKQAQDCMLKYAEGVRKGLRLIFCTDSPEKLDKALVGRLTQYELARPENSVMAEFIRNVANKEGIKIDDAAVIALCKASNDMRKLLNNLEAMAGPTPITLETVEAFVATNVDDEESSNIFQMLTRPLIWPEMVLKEKKPGSKLHPITLFEVTAPDLRVILETNRPQMIALAIAGYCRNALLNEKWKRTAKGVLKDPQVQANEFVRLQRVLRIFSTDLFMTAPENRLVTLYYQAITEVIKP